MSSLNEVQNFVEADISRYKKLTPKIYGDIRKASKKINPYTIIHINATSTGGGVAELLKSQIPLERSIGLKSYWLTIKAPSRFFIITKKIHNFLQGKIGSLSDAEKKIYFAVNHKLADSLNKFAKEVTSGIVVVHDPQSLPIIQSMPVNLLPILRLHIDLLTPNPNVITFLRPYIEKYKLVILSNQDYQKALAWFNKSKIKIVPPAIDPFSEKNRPMRLESAIEILEQFNINCSRPTIVQVSRFDSWKDPMGVIRAYYLAKNKISNLQLILAGFFLAKDDLEAIDVFQRVKKHAAGDPADIHLFSDVKILKAISNDSFISALYTASTVVIQKSIREGFGLTITEAMWKGKAVVAGMTSGTLMQIKNGKNGVLVSSPESAARAIVKLIKDKQLRKKIGIAAQKSVRKKFLLSRFLLDNIKIYSSVIKK